MQGLAPYRERSIAVGVAGINWTLPHGRCGQASPPHTPLVDLWEETPSAVLIRCGKRVRVIPPSSNPPNTRWRHPICYITNTYPLLICPMQSFSIMVSLLNLLYACLSFPSISDSFQPLHSSEIMSPFLYLRPFIFTAVGKTSQFAAG